MPAPGMPPYFLAGAALAAGATTAVGAVESESMDLAKSRTDRLNRESGFVYAKGSPLFSALIARW